MPDRPRRPAAAPGLLDRLGAAWHALTGGEPVDSTADSPPVDGTKASAVGPLLVAGRVSSPVSPFWSPAKLTAEGYGANIVAYLCIRLVADSFAALPYLFFRGETEVENHPLAALLDRPNPLQGRARWLQALAIELSSTGNAFVEAVRPGKRRPPKELFQLATRHVRILPGPTGLPGIYRFEAPGGKRDFPLDSVTGLGDVLHLREPNPLDRAEEFGFAPTQAAARWIDLDNAGADRRIDNSRGVDPDVAVVFKTGVETQDQLDEVSARVRQRWAETRRLAAPLTLGGDVEVTRLGQSLRDLQWTDGMHEAARRICAAWNVPHILVVPGESTYANREQARLELWEHTVLPFARLVLDDLNPWFRFLYNDPGLEIRIDEDAITALEPRRATMRQGALLAFEKGVLSLNEARLVLGYEPAEENQDSPADEPAALRNARQASMLAEAQQEALRRPAAQQDSRDGEEGEDEEDGAASPAIPPRGARPALVQSRSAPANDPRHQDKFNPEQPRVPGGQAGGGRWTVPPPETAEDPATTALIPPPPRAGDRPSFLAYLRAGKALPAPEAKAEADDFVDEAVDDAALAAEALPVVRDILSQAGIRVFLQLDLGLSFDLHDPKVADFLRDFAGDRIKELVGTTTRARLGEALAEVIEEGATWTKINDAIRAVFAEAKGARAATIAATETTRAVGWATQDAMETAGVERRAWLSSRDAWVRDTHNKLDGDVVLLDQPFEVNGHRAMYPGGFGRADEDCNCRCIVVPLPDSKAIERIATKEARDLLWKEIAKELQPLEERLAAALRLGFDLQERRLIERAFRRYGAIVGPGLGSGAAA